MADIKLEPGWKEVLTSEIEKPYFQEIRSFLVEEIKEGKSIYPEPKNIFAALDSCPWDKVKVVILGQDPYHSDEDGLPHAHGLSFSIPKEAKKIPPSLQNIYKELKTDLEEGSFQMPNHGNLNSWADQGVLLLNATLTVEAHQANSHSHVGWQTFTDHIIQAISEYNEGCVFLLWGKFAQSKEVLIDTNRHLVIKSAHPSPFSAHSGFFGSKPFSQTNQYLIDKGQKAINWNSING